MIPDRHWKQLQVSSSKVCGKADTFRLVNEQKLKKFMEGRREQKLRDTSVTHDI